MKFFVQPTDPPRVSDRTVYLYGACLAGAILLMTVAQLYSFEDYPAVVLGFKLPGGEYLSSVYAALIVSLGVGSLPYLLHLKTSPAMRVVSMVFGWVYLLFWLVQSLRIAASIGGTINSGVLGATISTPAGWWTVLLFVFLSLCAVRVARGMWPLR